MILANERIWIMDAITGVFGLKKVITVCAVHD